MNWRAFIEAEKAHHPVTDLCRVMKVSRAAYYRNQGVTKRSQDDDRLAELMKANHRAKKKALGARGHVAELASAGERCSRRRARRLMRREKLVSCHTLLFKPTTTIASISPYPPDLVKRTFFAAQPNRLLVGDIMYIPTDEDWMYLCQYLDVFDRSIAGWALTDHMRDELPIAALQMAIQKRHFEPGAIRHTDRGSNLMSGDNAAVLRDAEMLASVGKTGVCWDNAMAESLNGTWRKELLQQHWRTKLQLRRAVPGLVDYYNTERRHSSLGYLTPQEFSWCHQGLYRHE
jgi:transposase InsO family protein